MSCEEEFNAHYGDMYTNFWQKLSVETLFEKFTGSQENTLHIYIYIYHTKMGNKHND
jgi:hypothetical protein